MNTNISASSLQQMVKNVEKAATLQVAPDSTEISQEVEVFKEKILAAAEDGKWEVAVTYLNQDVNFLHHLCQSLKKELSDIMVMSDLGNRRITASWYTSNEV